LSSGFPPAGHVAASRLDAVLQSQHDSAEAKRELLDHARSCVTCDRPAADLEWFWFRSPPETWRMLCGQAGWMTWCPVCERRVDFFVTVIN
jgi:hypothetical protein